MLQQLLLILIISKSKRNINVCSVCRDVYVVWHHLGCLFAFKYVCVGFSFKLQLLYLLFYRKEVFNLHK